MTVTKKAENIVGPRRGPGRPKGSLNKTTLVLDEAARLAADAAGGPDQAIGYLRRVAVEQPRLFLRLLAKMIR